MTSQFCGAIFPRNLTTPPNVVEDSRESKPRRRRGSAALDVGDVTVTATRVDDLFRRLLTVVRGMVQT